jgi:hypothetical protein
MINLKAYLVTEKEPPKDGSYFMAFKDTEWGLKAFQCRWDDHYMTTSPDTCTEIVIDFVFESWCELPMEASLYEFKDM